MDISNFSFPRKNQCRKTDAASRHPSPERDVALLEHGDHMEFAMISSIKHSTDALSITWNALTQATQRDSTLKLLLDYTAQGFPDVHTTHTPRTETLLLAT